MKPESSITYGCDVEGRRTSVSCPNGTLTEATCTYLLDKSGRLVEKTINRWVANHSEHLAQGFLDNCQIHFANSRVQLLGSGDPHFDEYPVYQTLVLTFWRDAGQPPLCQVTPLVVPWS